MLCYNLLIIIRRIEVYSAIFRMLNFLPLPLILYIALAMTDILYIIVCNQRSKTVVYAQTLVRLRAYCAPQYGVGWDACPVTWRYACLSSAWLNIYKFTLIWFNLTRGIGSIGWDLEMHRVALFPLFSDFNAGRFVDSIFCWFNQCFILGIVLYFLFSKV